jgi:hypothetical protein
MPIATGFVVPKIFFFVTKHERRDGNRRCSAKITNNQTRWDQHDPLEQRNQWQLNEQERKLVEAVKIGLQTALSNGTVQELCPLFQSRILHHSILRSSLNRLVVVNFLHKFLPFLQILLRYFC